MCYLHYEFIFAMNRNVLFLDKLSQNEMYELLQLYSENLSTHVLQNGFLLYKIVFEDAHQFKN